MSQRKTSLDPRHIEFDGLANIMFALAFLLVAGALALIIGNATQALDAPVIAAASLIAAGVIAAWIVGYPRYAAIPAMSLVLMCGLLILPLVFDMNGALLREATGTPVARLYIAIGLYIGGLGLVFLAFILFGFIGPLVGAMLRLKRGEPHARETLTLHLMLCGVAIALTLGVRLLL